MEEGYIASYDFINEPIYHCKIPLPENSRFNDYTVDRIGRIFTGNVPKNNRSGNLFKIDITLDTTIISKEIFFPNGMAFDEEMNFLYVSDTFNKEIHKFDYNISTGTVTNKKLFVQINESDSAPDGLTIDSENHIWAAINGASKVIRFNPNGDLEREILLPAKNVTSLCFGGADLKTVFISTESEKSKYPFRKNSGSILSLQSEIKGRNENYSKINLNKIFKLNLING